MLIFISELDDLLVSKSSHVVGFDDSCENWESVFHVSSIIKLIDEDSSNFDLVSWSSSIDKIIENENFLLSWHTSWRNRAWGLLNCPFLIVSIDRFVVLEEIWSLSLANDTLTKVLLLLLNIVMEEWTLKVLAGLTSEVHFLKLWENCCSLGDDSSNLDEGVQVNLSQVSQLVLNWKILHSHEDLVVDLVVVWINLNNYINGNLVDDVKHQLWLLSQPNGQSWVFSTQVIEDDFQDLFVILAHIMDLCLIKIDSLISFEMSDELLELSLDIPDNLLLFKPDK
jgi:hypothetical protein